MLIALKIAMYRYQKNQELISRQRDWLSGLLRTIIATDGTKSEKALSLARALTSFLPFDFILIDTNLKDQTGAAFFAINELVSTSI